MAKSALVLLSTFFAAITSKSILSSNRSRQRLKSRGFKDTDQWLWETTSIAGWSTSVSYRPYTLAHITRICWWRVGITIVVPTRIKISQFLYTVFTGQVYVVWDDCIDWILFHRVQDCIWWLYMSVLSTLCMSLLMNCHFVIAILTNLLCCI